MLHNSDVNLFLDYKSLLSLTLSGKNCVPLSPLFWKRNFAQRYRDYIPRSKDLPVTDEEVSCYVRSYLSTQELDWKVVFLQLSHFLEHGVCDHICSSKARWLDASILVDSIFNGSIRLLHSEPSPAWVGVEPARCGFEHVCIGAATTWELVDSGRSWRRRLSTSWTTSYTQAVGTLVAPLTANPAHVFHRVPQRRQA